jgi:hypothetical protein
LQQVAFLFGVPLVTSGRALHFKPREARGLSVAIPHAEAKTYFEIYLLKWIDFYFYIFK